MFLRVYGISALLSHRHVNTGVSSPGNRPVPALTPGDRVTHDKFGLGTVMMVEGADDRAEAKIDFGGDYGVKHLVLRYAPLEKL